MRPSFVLLRLRSDSPNRTPFRLWLLATLVVATVLASTDVSSATAGSLSGYAYEDLDRDAVRDAGEPAYQDHQLYLFNASGSYVGTTVTDATGRYAFGSLAAGDYRVEYAAPSWWPIREDRVPTTTGSVLPRKDVHVDGTALADFGWRPIVRSTDLNAPISSLTGSSGVRVKSYNDAVTASQIHAALAAGLLGAEAPSIEIRFGYGSASVTASAAFKDGPGMYTSYSASAYVSYASWLDTGDGTLAHEYGHAWSGYYAHLAQQDPSLAGYLSARGLTGDPRLGTAYEWDPAELIAEDYRQLFGSPTAASSSQMNTEIPPAASVPGLRDYLSTTFTSGAQPGPTPTPPPTPAPSMTVTSLAVAPTPVKSAATITFELSLAGTLTAVIRDASGALVRTLKSGVAAAAGLNTVTWNRKNGAGQRVKAGTYTVVVQAAAGSEPATTAQRSFSVV